MLGTVGDGQLVARNAPVVRVGQVRGRWSARVRMLESLARKPLFQAVSAAEQADYREP